MINERSLNGMNSLIDNREAMRKSGKYARYQGWKHFYKPLISINQHATVDVPHCVTIW